MRIKFGAFILLSLLILSAFPLQAVAKVEIKYTFWAFGEDSIKQAEAICNAFNAKQDQIVVSPDPIPGAFWAVLLARIAGGNPPDTCWFMASNIPYYVDKGMLLDLTPYIERDNYDMEDFFPHISNAFKLNGRYYAIPTAPGGMDVIGYNKDMFDAAGAEYPSDDWTWDDLVALARKVTIRDGKGKAMQFGITGFFGFFADGSSFLPVLWSNGGELYEKMDYPLVSTVTSKEVVEALTYVRDLRFKHKVEAMPGEQTRLMGGEHFLAGESAMGLVRHTVERDLKKMGSKFRWNITTFPKGTKGNSVELNCLGYAIFKGSKNPDATWEFVKFLTSPEGERVAAAAIGNLDTLLVSSRQSHLREIIEKNRNKQVNTQAIYKSLIFGRPYSYRHKDDTQLVDSLVASVRRIYAGEIDVLPAMKQLKPVLDSILKKVNR